MTDYKEEQANEIEALESIYPDELQVVSTKPFHCFRMVATSQCVTDIEQATCIMQFTYTEKYPDEVPQIEILSYENIDEEDSDSLLQMMKEQGEENLGMAMVFTLVSAAQEKMSELVESAAQRAEEAKASKRREAEEAERKKFEGTCVTIETFLAWKEKFDAEMSLTRKDKLKSTKENSKLTGKELFMQDHTLDDSDVKFLEEAGEVVAVDESLFQDMDELDLDDAEDFDLDLES